MKVIHTDQAPAAVGPYSQAIEANGVLYCSGQIAINPAEGKIVAKTIEEQAEQCCRNVEAVLKEAGTDMGHVVKTTCFLAEIADFRAFNEVYARHFISTSMLGFSAFSCLSTMAIAFGE